MAPMRRKSQGSIRSPHVKRNTQSQVTYEGWLFKLEGGALKQWKQRWCALVDFCLFFYKGPHDEKVTSSILLPSYKINPCSTEDKISKKFAFKAEHQNMKTYYFATEDKDQMKKWMNVMSLATIMQNSASAHEDDDEESGGFPSYPSRYQLSCRSRSAHSNSCPSEPLKQRSNSCGERVGEMYLSSDDKYPSLYKSTPSQLCRGPPMPPEGPRNQPLYANAPPKPRRLTQADGFAAYPSDCYYGIDGESTFVGGYQYDVDFSNACQESARDPSYPFSESENAPEVRHSRPRSADFLEKENESYRPPFTSQYYENRQPQRPKSSLECYNRVGDCEDDGFDDYREALRMQADNLYASKHLMKNSYLFKIPSKNENITTPDSRGSNSLVHQHAHVTKDPIPMSVSDLVPKEAYSDLMNSNLNLHHETQVKVQQNSKSPHNESMQRLIEWKQRMLQSPLSKRNHLHSTSSEASSVNSFKHTNFHRHYKQQSPLFDGKMSSPYQNSPSVGRPAGRETFNQNYKDAGKAEGQSECTADNFGDKNVLYCVDSENNEILLSYDSSPTSPFHSSHYPPQMHSFSTMPNVSDIGMDSAPVAEHPMKSNQETNRARRDSGDINSRRRTTYSSDDEDEAILDSNSKNASPSKMIVEDKHFESPSPDYVNIGSICRERDFKPSLVYSATSGCVEVNQAVLKPLEQVSKTKKPFKSCFKPLPDITKTFNAEYCGSPELEKLPHSSEKKSGDADFKFAKKCQSDDFPDGIDCDIKREDYYRASQLFYSSIRMRNNSFVSPSKNTTQVSDPKIILQNVSSKKKSFKEIDGIDKDVGIPLSVHKTPSKSELPGEISDPCTSADGTISHPVSYKIDYQPDLEDGVIKRDKVVREFLDEKDKQELKKNLSYEEMRGQLLRKREAPPPNIVQDRIKKFETAKKKEETKKSQPVTRFQADIHCNKFSNRSFTKRSRLKNSRMKFQKRILHSDSEAVAFDDSDASSDDLTMKSAPIFLSPLSSVLADLRKTADLGKEKAVQPLTGNSRAADDSNSPTEDSHSKVSQNSDDAVYLPMYGIKAIKEPDYVTMCGSKLCSGSSKSKANKYGEEHVYNEPFSPPPSFLHDVYGKQKAKLFQYQMDSSSEDDSLTENIYEKPVQRFPADSSHSLRNTLTNSFSCSNVTSFSDKSEVGLVNNVFSHRYEQAQMSVSVPDLLQLQEIKDSDASDADDEASRDFDAAVGSSASSHQFAGVNNFCQYASSASSDTKLNRSPARKPNLFLETGPLYEKIACNGVYPSLGQRSLEESKPESDESEKVLHVRKLRVYTKGKKPETPRIFSVPFNIEEVEQNRTGGSNENYDLESKKTDDISFSENVAYVSRSECAPISAPNTCEVSYTPDIISSVIEDDRMCENLYAKASSSAPYYYSDLYASYGINFSSSPSLKQHDVVNLDKTSPPKSSTSLLNNIRPKSPCAKNVVGRKVNNINTDTKEKPQHKYSKEEHTKSNIKNSLNVFLVPESKYEDTEKNKYEAGSTLEKTRPSNSLAYLKHRVSTPDVHLHQTNEPVYENLLFQSKRISQSLEEISACEKTDELKLFACPVYENIEFFNRFESAKFPEISDKLPSSKGLPGDRKETSLENLKLTCSENSSHFEVINERKQASEQDMSFLLNQDLSKHAGKQHLNSKVPEKRPSSCKSLDVRGNSSQTVVGPILASPTYFPQQNACKNIPTISYKVNDSESTSEITSSCDEASADSDNRHRPSFEKTSFDYLLDSASVPQTPKEETLHLRKLVQQSNGLMCRGKRLSVSAGDLLGKTHEELVLLLIHLRRNQTKILKAKEKLESKTKVNQMKSDPTSEQYKELCNQIVHLEKQYEVTQPLVTLVDNMVKLGSLYGSSNRRSLSLPLLDCAQDETPCHPSSHLNYQHSSILSKLLTEENDLQAHLHKISKLEKSLQNESDGMSNLHQDKEMLEHTLFGMRNKILDHQDRPAELQKLRKQQRMIEKELVRVKRLLNMSAKKIEDATSKNDQMEQEILHLRHILQQALKTGSAEMKSSHHSRADLEAELTRLQSVLDELANHRQEINNSVEKLKRSKETEVRASPTGVSGSAPLPLRKKHHCMYLETDLDTMETRDLAASYEKDMDDVPVYANAEEISVPNEESATYDAAQCQTDPEACPLQDINEADERMKRFYGILPKEKPSEIKTVRIVKRQSERRSRERDKKRVTYDEQSSVWITEEPDLSSDDYLEVEESNTKKVWQANRPSSINLVPNASNQQNSQSAHERLFGNAPPRQKSASLRKPKRRHYTVSGYQYMLDPQFSQYFTERPRSRDDVDMERCLRTANTPDIVRSTIKKKDIFDDKLIDRELALPQKIEIPERYVEVEPEQLSASERLRRSLKAENICKMLSETTTPYQEVVGGEERAPEALHRKLSEEKRKRAQLLSLNQALAREVVERSKAVAANIFPYDNSAAT